MAAVDRVVIGEAVELDVRTARLPSRALALTVDVVIMVVLLGALLLGVLVIGSEVDEAAAAAIGLVLVVATFVGYPLLWETLTRGRSPGKYAMGLRVVRTDGGPIVVRHALARALAGFIVDFGLLSLFTGFIGIVVSAVSPRGQRVGDLLAGTVVVRERLPRSGSADLPPADPALAAWATGCELSRLPDDLALAARQFLVRAPQLAAGMRYALAERLAADVATRVAPSPPYGVPAEAYLRAVLGERRRRETERLGAGTPWGTRWATPWGPGAVTGAAPAGTTSAWEAQGASPWGPGAVTGAAPAGTTSAWDPQGASPWGPGAVTGAPPAGTTSAWDPQGASPWGPGAVTGAPPAGTTSAWEASPFAPPPAAVLPTSDAPPAPDTVPRSGGDPTSSDGFAPPR